MSGKVGILGLMFLVMFAIKVAGVAALSWWVVTAPLWGGLAFWFVVIILGSVVAIWLADRKERREAQWRRDHGRRY